MSKLMALHLGEASFSLTVQAVSDAGTVDQAAHRISRSQLGLEETLG
jgi:hypothetical protein